MILAFVVATLLGCAGITIPSKTPSEHASAALQIATTSLAAGSGAVYSATLSATGGTPPYVWSIGGGSLPTGLHLNLATGTISGTPGVSGDYHFTAQVYDSKYLSASAGLPLNITPPPGPSISSISPSSGPIAGGTAVTISGSNFQAGSVVQFGSIPSVSVQVVNSNQIRCITPTEGIGTVSVTVQDSGSQATTAQNAFTFSASPLEINTSSIRAGTVGVSYSSTLTATGGVPPYTWSTTRGALPTGVQLNTSSGALAGSPTRAGSFFFTVQVQDAKASSSSTGVSLNVAVAQTLAGSVVGITSPSAGGTISGITTVSASATNSQSGISMQFYLNGSPLGSAVTSGPYTVDWDTTQIADGNYTLAVQATDATGKTTTSPSISVMVQNLYWNPSVLGVPWASDFNSIAANEINVKTDSRLSVKAAGDGVADDTAAIRSAIQIASSLGGGVVYFPTGNYKIVVPSNSTKGSPLLVPSRVVLRGNSSTTSSLNVNDSSADSESDGTWTWGGIAFEGASLSGMTDLGVNTLNPSTSPCAVVWNRGSSNVSELFFTNLNVQLGNGRYFWFESIDKLLVQNSHIDSNATKYGPIYVVADSNVSFLNNIITYHFGRVQMQNNVNLLMQGNSLIRDAENMDMDSGTAIESGGVELSFGQNIQVLNNTIQTLNAPSAEAGDGEAIMTQQSVIQDVLDAGVLTSATSTTLTDTSSLWGPVTATRIAQYPEVVAILSGAASGEWTPIKGVDTSTKTLNLRLPWSVVPEPGSLYSIFSWTLMHANIQGNKLLDNPNGIVLYSGCYDCTVQGNALTNSRQIILRVMDEALNHTLYPEGRRVHEIALDSKILNNTVSNTSGIRPAYIALDVEAFATDSYKGLGMLNIQMTGNIINPYVTNPSKNYPNPMQTEITQEGFFPCFIYGPAAVKDPLSSVFQVIEFSNNFLANPVAYNLALSRYTSQSCVSTPN